MKDKLKKYGAKFAGNFPSALPVGTEDFHKFAESIFYAYDLPDMPSYRQAIATMVMHLPPTNNKAPKKFFATCVKKAMANQVAYEVIQSLKDDEKKAQAVEPVAETVSESVV